MSKGKILFQLSGSIACFKACAVISQLVQRGYEVETVATAAALKFIGEATLEGLTGRKVHSDVFARGEYMNHIHLARWADLMILCPATARSINSLAAGTGEDLVSALFLAHDFTKPYLLAPAMNAAMLAHPATQKSLASLKEWGVRLLGCGQGALACGETGDGRLLEPDQLLQIIEAEFQPVKSTSALRVLVTAGGTSEPIDGVRSITNFSSGQTGVEIADRLHEAGHRVTLLRATSAVKPGQALDKTRAFTSYASLRDELREELSGANYDAVIHAAAVSDFSVDTVEVGGKRFAPNAKLESSEALTLHLKSNPKLVDELKSWTKNPALQVIAFKLTNGASPAARLEAVRALAKRSGADFIVQNDLTEIDSAEGRHHALVLDARDHREPRLAREVATKRELAEALRAILERKET